MVFFYRYNESGKENDLEKCQEQMERLERKAKKYYDERESLAENINAINKDIATQKVYTQNNIGFNIFHLVAFFKKLANLSVFTVATGHWKEEFDSDIIFLQERQRELEDNQRLRKKQREVREKEQEITDLEKEIGDLDVTSMEREKQRLRVEQSNLWKEVSIVHILAIMRAVRCDLSFFYDIHGS